MIVTNMVSNFAGIIRLIFFNGEDKMANGYFRKDHSISI